MALEFLLRAVRAIGVPMGKSLRIGSGRMTGLRAIMKASKSVSGRVAFWALLAVVVGLGILLYRIIEPFLIPLFFAAMLAMLCRPQFEWVVSRIGGKRR